MEQHRLFSRPFVPRSQRIGMGLDSTGISNQLEKKLCAEKFGVLACVLSRGFETGLGQLNRLLWEMRATTALVLIQTNYCLTDIFSCCNASPRFSNERNRRSRVQRILQDARHEVEMPQSLHAAFMQKAPALARRRYKGHLLRSFIELAPSVLRCSAPSPSIASPSLSFQK